jgi:hypothetical protein
MARQWRIEYEGALYHVISRGKEIKTVLFIEEKAYHIGKQEKTVKQ